MLSVPDFGGVKEDSLAAVRRIHAEASRASNSGFKSWSEIEDFVSNYVKEAKKRTLHLGGIPQMHYPALVRSLASHFHYWNNTNGNDGDRGYISMTSYIFMGPSGQNEAIITFDEQEDAVVALASIKARPLVDFREVRQKDHALVTTLRYLTLF